MSSETESAEAIEVAYQTFANNAKAIFWLRLVGLLTTVQCATASFIAILVYDWLLTLRPEVEYIWKQKMTFGKLLYLINRYLVIVDLIILLNSYANPIIHGSQVCKPWFHIDSWLAFISIVAIDIMMLLRTWAMWHRSKKVLIFLVILQALCNLAEGGATLWASLTLFSIPSQNNIRPCLSGFARPDVLYALWMGVIVWDLGMVYMFLQSPLHSNLKAIMILTLIRAASTVRSHETTNSIIALVVKDGVQYFVLIFLIAIGNIVVINIAPGPLATMLLTLQRVTNSVIGSRMMLNLRGTLMNSSHNRRGDSTAAADESTMELTVLHHAVVITHDLGRGK
ncbi:hypothetical protein C8J57DRAFT_1477786 [Mycena rebaudengoi]|nr:hypothetical protein C8J57DRAFT_1477786 [Mycena rebaudengoi]